MRPSPTGIGTRLGTSSDGPVWSTSAMPAAALASIPDTAGSLGKEYSPKPSALRQQTAAMYSIPSCTPEITISVFGAASAVLPLSTSRPLAASTSMDTPFATSVSRTCEASTGGQALGSDHEHLSLPGEWLSSVGINGGDGL